LAELIVLHDLTRDSIQTFAQARDLAERYLLPGESYIVHDNLARAIWKRRAELLG